jgi:hypothetical protein
LTWTSILSWTDRCALAAQLPLNQLHCQVLTGSVPCLKGCIYAQSSSQSSLRLSLKTQAEDRCHRLGQTQDVSPASPSAQPATLQHTIIRTHWSTGIGGIRGLNKVCLNVNLADALA